MFQIHYPLVKTLFLFGRALPNEKAFPIGPEQVEHCDMVQMDYLDCYENVTLDTVSCLKFALSGFTPDSRPDFVVIGDDDTYINVPMLWALLYEEKAIKPDSKYLLGYRYSKVSI